LGFFKRDPEYYEFFCNQVCAAAEAAIADMQEATASIARGKAEGISFIRRVRMKDGSTRNGVPADMIDQIAGPIGTPDETVQLVKLQRPGAADIAIVNFGCHPDVLGGTGICPDWPAFMRNTVEAALPDVADGKGVKVIFFNGAQGDVAHVNKMAPMPGKGLTHSRHMGRVLAGTVLSIYTYTQPINSDKVFFKQNFAHVPVAKGTPEEVKIAAEIHEKYSKGEDVSGYPFDIVRARRYLRLELRNAIIDLNIVCVGFGDLAFVGLPGEPFTEIGRQIKEKSPFAMTIPCCNANGSEGYFPTDDALLNTGYESNSSFYKPGLADTLVQVSLETLQEVLPKK
jgi:hypothetical protein